MQQFFFLTMMTSNIFFFRGRDTLSLDTTRLLLVWFLYTLVQMKRRQKLLHVIELFNLYVRLQKKLI